MFHLRQAVQSLLRTPVFSSTVIGLLAVGIGANTLIFTAIDALLFRPLAVSQPEQIVHAGIQYAPNIVFYEHPYFYGSQILERTHSFSQVFSSQQWETMFTTGQQSKNIAVETVSGNYFSALGIAPQDGRLLTDEDEHSDSQVAIISASLAQQFFPYGHPIGSPIRVRGALFTIVGVMNPSFYGTNLDQKTDIWLTMSALKPWFSMTDNRRSPVHLFMRLKEGIQTRDAESDLRSIYPSIVETDYKARNKVTQEDINREKSRLISVESAQGGFSRLRKTFSTAAAALMGAVGLLFILVCFNVGSLLLARAETRLHNMAIRVSLGASRIKIFQHVFLEVFILAIFGTFSGWMLALWCSPLLSYLLPQRRPLAVDLSPDIRVVVFASILCFLAILFLSLLPAWRSLKIDPNVLLSRSGSGRVTGNRIGRTLVASQVALSTVLLFGAVMLAHTLNSLRSENPGFRRQNMVVMNINPEIAGIERDKIPATFNEIIHRTKELPGVEVVSLTSVAVMRGIGMVASIVPSGHLVGSDDLLKTSMNGVSASHFSNLGMVILEGRGLVEEDANVSPFPAVVSKSFARKYFPDGNVLGQMIGLSGSNQPAPPSYQIVGVVNDAKYRSMREDPPPTMYSLLNQENITSSGGQVLYISTYTDPQQMIIQLRELLQSIGPGIIPTDVATMEQEIETSLWQERLLAALATIFAILAAILAGFGLFGMLAYTVSQRTREIGIRMAIGATTSQIAKSIAKDSMRVVVPGFAIGLILYFAASRIISSLLYSNDAAQLRPAIMTGSTILGIAILATAFPILRATNIHPSQALRDE